MPGTLGSLAGLIIYFLVKNNFILHGFSIIFLFILGLLFSAEAEQVYKMKDPKMIIIDEACGMILALYLVPCHISLVIIGFLLFRSLDIIKPPPAKRVERLSGAFGIMFDDIVAAFYTNILLQIIARAFHFSA